MSLDGFIAGPGGDMSWLTEHLGPNPTVDELVGRIGALLVGYRTCSGDDPYRGVAAREGEPFGGGWSGPQFVLTHHAPATPVPGVTFVGDLHRGVAAAKAAAADLHVNVLGANLAWLHPGHLAFLSAPAADAGEQPRDVVADQEQQPGIRDHDRRVDEGRLDWPAMCRWGAADWVDRTCGAR